MNLKELTWPVRIYWDLAQAPSDPSLCLNTCEQIVAIKILFLSLREPASPISPACLDMLDTLRGHPIAVSLTISGSALSPSLFARLSGSKIKTLLINTTSLSEVRSAVEKIAHYRNSGLLPGISFEIGTNNYRDIPEVVSLCVDNGILDLVFPIQRFMMRKEFFYITREEGRELSLRLRNRDYRKIRITIHDPFLWKVFYPDTDYHEGGCQAANSMLYLSPEYRVYPCPAMSVELGDLHETTLREIILSGEKRNLRLALLDPPEECAECDQINKCMGGCRGRAFSSTGSLCHLDPACK
jgi:GeoRSP system SPASM domain protein